jgi:broad specificity phosphatase PhoE
MSTVILVRPGCTDFDDQKRLQGSLDLPLNERGENQLARVVEAIRELPIEAVLTSSCEPCFSSAEALAKALDVPLKKKGKLENLDQGLWQGLSIDEIRHKFPKVFKQWEDAPETVCPPEGETVTEGVIRIESVLKKPLKKYGTFVVVASEPFASLISASLRGVDADGLCASLFGCCEDHLVEVIQTEQNGSEHSRNGHSSEIPIAVASATK